LTTMTPTKRATRDHERARRRLRGFAAFLAEQDPETLAASVVSPDLTLNCCTTIERFFRAYVQALYRRTTDVARVAARNQQENT